MLWQHTPLTYKGVVETEIHTKQFYILEKHCLFKLCQSLSNRQLPLPCKPPCSAKHCSILDRLTVTNWLSNDCTIGHCHPVMARSHLRFTLHLPRINTIRYNRADFKRDYRGLVDITLLSSDRDLKTIELYEDKQIL